MKKALPVSVIMAAFAALLVGAAVAGSLLMAAVPSVALNESQILYLSSTSAQVVAAVYGLTLTGFIFFRSELSREGVEDETLRDAVESLKARYFALLLFITVLVIVSLLLANLTMVVEGSKEAALRRVVLSAGQAGFLTSLLAIAYFVFDVISPTRIERASQGLRAGIDPRVDGQPAGSLDEFSKNYAQIEALLDEASKDLFGSRAVDERRSRRRMPNDRLVEILFRSQHIERGLHRKLRDLITLNNAILHGADPVVSEDMVKTSADAVAELKAALEKPIQRRGRMGRR